jgi:hypothetical protein
MHSSVSLSHGVIQYSIRYGFRRANNKSGQKGKPEGYDPTRNSSVAGFIGSKHSTIKTKSPLPGILFMTLGGQQWARQDSNLRPNGYEPSALPLSYGPLLKCQVLQCQVRLNTRAGDGIRTREYQLGRLMPYHLATPALWSIFYHILPTHLSHTSSPHFGPSPQERAPTPAPGGASPILINTNRIFKTFLYPIHSSFRIVDQAIRSPSFLRQGITAFPWENPEYQTRYRR